MEAENLINQQNLRESVTQIKGPIQFQGSNRFYNGYKKNRFESFVRIFSLPNKTQKTLINDFQNKVDASSFLGNGNILLKISNRFMIFSSDGNFITEATFSAVP